jgi:hypothetical protein
MLTASASLGLPVDFGHRWAKVPTIENPDPELPIYDTWPHCVRMLWERFLRHPNQFGKTTFKERVWEMARICGVGIRCIFKALRWARDHGIVDRHYEPVRHDQPGSRGGFVTRTILPIKDKAKTEAKAKAKTQSKAKAKPADSQVPNVGTIAPMTTEQQAAHQKNLDGAAAASSSEVSPEEQAETDKEWARIKAKAEVERRTRLGALKDDPTYAQVRAEMEAKEAQRRQSGQPAAAPPDPHPRE